MNQKPAVTTGQKIPFIRRHRSFFAGLFLLIPAVIIPLLLVYTLMKTEFMQGWCRLHVVSNNAYGLSKGSPVTVSGMTIGHVEKVDLVREGIIRVQFKVQQMYQHLVKKDTEARFQQKSPIVGEWIIELTGGSDSIAVVVDDDTLQAILPVRFDKTIQRVTAMVKAVSSVVEHIAAGRGTAGALLVGDTLSGLVRHIGGDVRGVMGTVDATLLNVDTLLKELTVLSRNSKSLIDSLDFITVEVRKQLEQVTAILDNVKNASGDVGPMIENVQDEINEVDRMMRTLQQSWIFRSMEGKKNDPLLKGVP